MDGSETFIIKNSVLQGGGLGAVTIIVTEGVTGLLYLPRAYVNKITVHGLVCVINVVTAVLTDTDLTHCMTACQPAR